MADQPNYVGAIKIPRAPRRGEVITGEFLQGLAGAVHGSTAPTRGVPAPKAKQLTELHGEIPGVGAQTVELYETNRITEEVRVENPLDSNQYVVVENVLQVTLQSSEGQIFIFNFASSEGNVTTGTAPGNVGGDMGGGGGAGGSSGSYVTCG